MQIKAENAKKAHRRKVTRLKCIFATQLTFKYNKMKKLTLILMAALLMTVAGSCKKDNDDNDNDEIITGNDGFYNPEKKIYKYYYWDSYDECRELREIWHWDGKRLESIDYGYESSYQEWYVNSTKNFSFENNRLVRVDDFDNLAYTEFTYNDGYLKKVSRYYKYELEEEYAFSYGSNNRVSQISFIEYDGNKHSKGHLNPLSMFLPEEISERVDEGVRRMTSTRRGANESVTASIKFTWKGDNISDFHIDVRYEEEEDGNTYSGVETVNATLQYDSKFNPRKGFLGLDFMEGYYGYGVDFYSKNNVTQMIYTWSEEEYENGVLDDYDSGTREYHYSYLYDDDNYPVRMNRTRIYDDGDTSTTTNFYEYL